MNNLDYLIILSLAETLISPIKTPLDSLTRVNYKIINPYKSGLSFKMLE